MKINKTTQRYISTFTYVQYLSYVDLFLLVNVHRNLHLGNRSTEQEPRVLLEPLWRILKPQVSPPFGPKFYPEYILQYITYVHYTIG